MKNYSSSEEAKYKYSKRLAKKFKEFDQIICQVNIAEFVDESFGSNNNVQEMTIIKILETTKELTNGYYEIIEAVRSLPQENFISLEKIEKSKATKLELKHEPYLIVKGKKCIIKNFSLPYSFKYSSTY